MNSIAQTPPDGGTLFGHLPADIFRLFAGPNRFFYADLLEYMDADLLGSGGGLVSKKGLIGAIREFIDKEARELVLESDGVNLSTTERAERDPRCFIAYRRLLDTGWLLESRDHYRVVVDFDPSARVLLQALLDIKAGRLRSYGGAVLKVLTLLESAKDYPAERSLNVREAGLSARAFMNHLRTVSGAMRKAEDLILGQKNRKSLFHAFFADFVEKYVVQDWKHLHTRDNPFRFRVQIRSVGRAMVTDDLLIDVLAKAYVREGRAEDDAHGRDLVTGELQSILRVFDSLDDHLDLIEATKYRIERRITNTVRFMDRVSDTSSERLEAALKHLGESPDPDDAAIDVPPRVNLNTLPTGGQHLFLNARPRVEVGPQKVRRPPADPAIALYEKALAAYQARVRMAGTTVSIR